MPDDDEEFWRHEYDDPAKAPDTTIGQDAAVRRKPPPWLGIRGQRREVRGPGVNLHKFLTRMPGSGDRLPESEMLVSVLHINTLHLALGVETNFEALERERILHLQPTN